MTTSHRPSNETSSAHSIARWSTGPSSSWTSSPAGREPGRGSCRSSWAQLDYWLPRLGGRGVELSRLGGGIGTRGPGETKLETDQRKIHQRIHKIKRDLQRVRAHRQLHRSFRQSVPVPTVSLVGYTNAGKSTLFNALTRSDTLASRQLFATLDPLLRRIRLPSKREVILSDTVGFISKLPATLVSAFRATLEEIGEAQLLLHVIDCSSPRAQHQRSSVLKVLEELGDSGKPTIEVYNKTDLLEQPPRLPPGDSVLRVSALRRQGISGLLERIDRSIHGDPLVRGPFRGRGPAGGNCSPRSMPRAGWLAGRIGTARSCWKWKPRARWWNSSGSSVVRQGSRGRDCIPGARIGQPADRTRNQVAPPLCPLPMIRDCGNRHTVHG